jgi:methyl-accepting chemotaxis protein
VDLAISELDTMNEQVSNAAISDQDKARLHVLLADYRRDFLALVEQNTRITDLQEEMREAVTQIAPIVRNNVEDADQAMTQVTAEIHSSSQADALLTRWIVTLAILLGILFAVAFTLSIARPLRRMAGLLDQLAYDVPVERVPVLPGGRDEVNAMAQSVNAMADHKARFIAWWKRSMREAEGIQKVRTADDTQQQEDAKQELRNARDGKEALMQELHQEIRAHTNIIVENAELLLKMHPHGTRYDETKKVEQSGKSVLTLLDMMQSER